MKSGQSDDQKTSDALHKTSDALHKKRQEALKQFVDDVKLAKNGRPGVKAGGGQLNQAQTDVLKKFFS